MLSYFDQIFIEKKIFWGKCFFFFFFFFCFVKFWSPDLVRQTKIRIFAAILKRKIYLSIKLFRWIMFAFKGMYRGMVKISNGNSYHAYGRVLYFDWVQVDPPLYTNGSETWLAHLSVKVPTTKLKTPPLFLKYVNLLRLPFSYFVCSQSVITFLIFMV